MSNETSPNLRFICQGCANYCICPDVDNYPGGCTDFTTREIIQELHKGHLQPRGETQLKIDI